MKRTPPMSRPLHRRTVLPVLKLAACVTLSMMLAPAQASLQTRDLNGDGTTDAFYDTDLNITWLRDANYAKTSGFDSSGTMGWSATMAWASTVVFGGYDDWRLPTTDVSTCDVFYHCTIGEMRYLWTVELGNEPANVVDDGDFQSLFGSDYWSGSEYEAGAKGLTFNFGFASTHAYAESFNLHALLVRPGDVSATRVPEPQTLFLALTALAAMGFARRRLSNRTLSKLRF